jgi:hypothetical protein
MQVEKDEIAINYNKFNEKLNKIFTKVFKIEKSCLNKSEFLLNLINNNTIEINTFSEEALKFVLNYLTFYKDIHEYPQPEYPLPDSTLEDIFENEKLIFGELLIIDKDKEIDKIEYVNNLLSLTKYLELDILFDKICAIMAMYIKSI